MPLTKVLGRLSRYFEVFLRLIDAEFLVHRREHDHGLQRDTVGWHASELSDSLPTGIGWPTENSQAFAVIRDQNPSEIRESCQSLVKNGQHAIQRAPLARDRIFFFPALQVQVVEHTLG